MKLVLAALAVTAVIGLSVWWEISLWGECRVDHGVSYCLRVLGK